MASSGSLSHLHFQLEREKKEREERERREAEEAAERQNREEEWVKGLEAFV